MHNDIVEELNNNIKNNELQHSYIFSGINGIGKKEVAFNFAKNILCKNENERKKFDANNCSDFQYIEPEEKGSIKIKAIRELIKDVNIKPIESEYKVYIINDADKMVDEAQNALLKTLEEPPSYVIIVLITSNYYGLIDTIRSRSQKLSFNKLEDSDILEYMNNNNISIDLDNDLLLFLVNGRIKHIKKVQDDVNTIKEVLNLINEIKEIDLIELYVLEKDFYEYKNNIVDVLDYMTNIYNYLFKKGLLDVLRISNAIKNIEYCKKILKGNINFEMAVDNLFQSLWEDWNV